MNSFNFYQPTKIHFGENRLDELGTISKKYGTKCLLVTTDKDDIYLNPLYNKVTTILENKGLQVFHYDKVIPNPTIEVVENALKIVNENNIDMIIPVGGGSSIDTGKAVALLSGMDSIDWDHIFANYTDAFKEYEFFEKEPLPIISVTTTSGTGSQLTQAMIISDPEKNEKNCIFHDKVFSKETIVDPRLMLTLPKSLTAATGFDSFSHSFESYMNDISSEYTKMVALSSMKIIIETLPRLLDNLQDLELRSQMAYADILSGITLTNAAANIPHPLSEIIGGVVPRISHGQCLAIVYPPYVSFTTKLNIEKSASVARLFDPSLINESDEVACNKLYDLMIKFLEKIELNNTLSKLDVTKEELEIMSNSFLLNVLPWAGKDVLLPMITDRY